MNWVCPSVLTNDADFDGEIDQSAVIAPNVPIPLVSIIIFKEETHKYNINLQHTSVSTQTAEISVRSVPLSTTTHKWV